jgi:hypothetical protein
MRLPSRTAILLPLLSACATPNKLDPTELMDASASVGKDGSPETSLDVVFDVGVTSDVAGSPDSVEIAHDTPTENSSSPDGSSDRQDAMAACTTTRCGLECVDTVSNPQHCGKCMITCAGSCTGGKCACETPSPANLVRNGGFDANVSEWRFGTQLTLRRSPQDASSCSGSGSLTLTFERPQADYTPDIWQCIELASDQGTFNAGVWTYVEPAAPRGYVDFWVEWYAQPLCLQGAGALPRFERRALPSTERSGEWRQLRIDNITPPPGTRSVRIRFGIYAQETSMMPFAAVADMLYFTPAPGGWK